MDTLAKLFGGAAYVKMMRLFLCNPDRPFETKDVKTRTQILAETAKRELAYIHSLGLIKRKTFIKETTRKTKKGARITKRKAHGWILNEDFPYLEQLRHILLDNELFRGNNVSNRFKNVGRLKLLVISGVFVNDGEQTENRGRVDILLVGDHLKQRIINTALKGLESEVGRELQYSVLKTDDFLYRRGMYDKFIRDIFDSPHEILVDKMGVK